MKTIHLTAYGNPAQNFKLVAVSEPKAPSASEVLVRMEYAPINDSDLLLANGVASGRLSLPITTTYKPSQIKEAIEHSQRGGKILLDFNHTK
jgi:NADPH:quinone reductase-like Zn-dependent oxidoreductase